MILSIEKKRQIVCKLQDNFKSALSVVVASLHKVPSNSLNELRKNARNLGVKIKVVPNSLLRLATKTTPSSCLLNLFIGQSIIAFSDKNASDAARIFLKFAKDHEYFKITGAVFEGACISLEQIDLLSNLPSHKEAIIRFVSVLTVVSIGNLINILHQLNQKQVKS